MSLWSPLRHELAIWRREAIALSLWWRDDDAVEATAELDRLQRLSEGVGVAVHLAVIPAQAQPSLGEYCRSAQFRTVAHGWNHENHAPPEEKSAEFNHPRTEAVDELMAGRKRLISLFENDIYPMFVPPWNRFAPEFSASLVDAGYQVLSTFNPRKTLHPSPGLTQINTHIDPVDWRGTRGLLEPEIIVKRLVLTLQERRAGEADSSEPLGLLTHHLMQDDQVWEFCAAVLKELRDGDVELFDIASFNSTNDVVD